MTDGPIRVLVVEDSATVREMLCAALRADPAFEVAGAAEDGATAVALCRELRSDVVSMDMVLPVQSGLIATEQIMAWCPTPILVVSSSFNRGEVMSTIDALAAGAVDVLEKPDGTVPIEVWQERYRAALRIVSRIRVITHLKARVSAAPAPSQPTAMRPRESAPGRQVIAIGASTGGPGAVVNVLRRLQPLPVPVLLVLHLNPQFGSALAEWLDEQSAWHVAFGRDDTPLSHLSGWVVLAPPDRHLVVENDRIRLSEAEPRHSCRPSVDVLFESVAAACGPAASAALLTGMGRDGAGGLRAIRDAGGETIAQDEATSVVYGMPREAVRLGAATRVLPLPEIGPALARSITARRTVA